MTATVMNNAMGRGQSAAGPRSAGARVTFLFGLGVVLLLLILFAADRIFNPAQFRITDIEVHGEMKNVQGEMVVAAVRESLSGNYFSSDLGNLEQRVEELPWVFSATIRRRWPSTLAVNIEEIEPVATWGESSWLNFTGDLVQRQGPDGLVAESALPRLDGPEEEIGLVWEMFSRWSGKFATSGLVLSGVTLNPRGLWELQLELGALARSRLPLDPEGAEQTISPVTMIVDRDAPSQRINRFIKAINAHLIDQFSYMRSVDLRYPNGFAIGWKDGMPDLSTQQAGMEAEE